MKFYNGEPVKVPVRKAMFIWGCILVGICLIYVILALTLFFSAESVGNSDGASASVISGGVGVILLIPFVPGLVLFIIGLSKMTKDIKKNKIIASTDINEWRSQHNQYSPVFSVVCAKCGGLIEYDIDGIDGTRLWYREGYVVCPRCNNVIRHSAGKDAQNFGAPDPAPAQTPVKYCSACGNKLSPTDAFCSSCGKKLS